MEEIKLLPPGDKSRYIFYNKRPDVIKFEKTYNIPSDFWGEDNISPLFNLIEKFLKDFEQDG